MELFRLSKLSSEAMITAIPSFKCFSIYFVKPSKRHWNKFEWNVKLFLSLIKCYTTNKYGGMEV
jgi:hypothetical protein